MVRMDKLLDAWRADPRVEPTVELCAMLTRASMKPGARDVIPIAFIVALATEAVAKHPRKIEVLIALAGLYHAAGELRHAASIVEKALLVAPDDERVVALATKLKMHRATRELVSDPQKASIPPPQAIVPSTPPPAKSIAAPPAKAITPAPANATAPPKVHPHQLDAETFDAPTTPLDPPTEPADPPTRTQVNAPIPRRTQHGLAPAVLMPAPPVAGPAIAAPPIVVPPLSPVASAAPPVHHEAEATEPNPRRSRTLLGGPGMLAPPAPMVAQAPMAVSARFVPPVVAKPAPPPPNLDSESDGDQATSVMQMSIDDDNGPSTNVDTVDHTADPKTTQRDVPVIPPRAPESRFPSAGARNDEPKTSQRDVPLIPSRAVPPPVESKTTQRDVPQIPQRAPLSKTAAAIVPPPPPSQPTAVVESSKSRGSDPGTMTRTGPIDLEADRPAAARRVAARKPGRGIGTDDPLMKAGLARRDRQATADPDPDPSTHAEHEVATRVGTPIGIDDERPTRAITAKNAPLAGARSTSTLDEPESAPTRTRASPLAANAPKVPPRLETPARGIQGGMLASHDTTQTEVDSVSEDAPTRTLTNPPPIALPRLSEAPERASSATNEDGSTFSKVVTTVWQGGSQTPPPPTADSWPQPMNRPAAQPSDDSVDTHLRPLAPMAPLRRPMTGPATGHSPRFDAPPAYTPVARQPEPEDEGPGTYVMRADEAQAASRVDPRPPMSSGKRLDEQTIDPSDVIEEPSFSGSSLPMSSAPGFGQPPSMLQRGVAFGAGAQAPDPMRPTMPLDFEMGNNGLAAFGDSASSPRYDGGFGDPSLGAVDPYVQQQAPQPGYEPRYGGGFDLQYDPQYDPSYASNQSYPQQQQQAPASYRPQFGEGAPGSSPPLSGYDPQLRQNNNQSFPPAPYPLSRMPLPVMDQAPAESPETHRKPVGLYIALGVAAVMVAVLVGYASFLVISDYKRTATAAAPRPTTEVEKAVLSGAPADLARADALLTELEKTPSREVALARVRAQVVRSLELSGKDEGIGPALDAAHAVGVGSDAASGEVALALSQLDFTKVDAIVAREDSGLAKDAFFQLAVGVGLEMRGDPRAIDRYDAAIAAEPRLMAAKIRAIRALLLEGDLPEAEKRLAELPESPSSTTLRALAWVAGRTAGATETVARPKSLPITAEVPRELLPVYAASSLLDAEKGDASSLTKRGIEEADSPGVAVLFGRLALRRNDTTSAAAAAQKALTMGARYAPALRLLGKMAIELGKFDAMTDVIAKLPEDATRELRSLRAYENGDLDDLSAIAAKVADNAPEKLVVSARLDRLRGMAALDDARITRLLASDALGADLCAVDALLDRGALVRAKEVVGRWTDATVQPLRARRYARLMRFEGNLDEALLALGGATTTGPTGSLERMILDAEIPKHRTEALELLKQRPSPLDIPPATAKLLEGYIRARDDDMRVAKEVIDGAQVPSKQTALPTRICAALAFGEVKDKRAEGLVRDLYASFPQNPDVLRAAQALGIASDSPKP